MDDDLAAARPTTRAASLQTHRVDPLARQPRTVPRGKEALVAAAEAIEQAQAIAVEEGDDESLLAALTVSGGLMRTHAVRRPTPGR